MTDEGNTDSILAQIIALLELYHVKWGGVQHLTDLHAQYREAFSVGSEGYRRDVLSGLEELFGGMGSLNDLVVSDLNGDAIKPEEEDAVNRDVHRLRHELYAAVSRERQKLG